MKTHPLLTAQPFDLPIGTLVACGRSIADLDFAIFHEAAKVGEKDIDGLNRAAALVNRKVVIYCQGRGIFAEVFLVCGAFDTAYDDAVEAFVHDEICDHCHQAGFTGELATPCECVCHSDIC